MVALALNIAAFLFVAYCCWLGVLFVYGVLKVALARPAKVEHNAVTAIPHPRPEEPAKRIVLVHFPKDETPPDTPEERKSREFLAREAERVKNEREANRGARQPFKQVPSTSVH